MPLIQFTGLASGIDAASLIDALVEAREQTNEIRRAEIDFLESENDSLEELNTKLLALSDLVDGFRTVNGGGIDKKATTSDATVLTGIAGTNAINASYDITVTSLADTATGNIIFGTGYSGPTDFFDVDNGTAQTLTITVGTGGDQVSYDVDMGDPSTTTIQSVVDEINGATELQGRASAQIVNRGAPSGNEYAIVISTLESGTSMGTLSLSYTGAGSIVLDDTSDVATDAVFSIAGIGSITRDTNNINDVLSGVTLNLTDTGSATLTVGNDVDTTATEIQEIVEAYNDIVEYINENDIVERVENGQDSANVFGSLAKTNIDNDFLASFRLSLLSADSSTGTTVTSFAEMGLSTNRDGTISFDSEEFKEKVSQDSIGAAEVITDFADSIGGVNGSIYQYTKFNGFIDTAQDANNSEISNLNDDIEQLERQTEKMRERMNITFAKLEQTTAELQSQQQALTGLLSGL